MTSVFAAADATDEFNRQARRLRDVLEPVASSVYFAPEVHAEFETLGFGPGVTAPDHVMLPDLAAYYCSRAGCLGHVPGPVVVSVFGVFDPALVIPEVERGWATASVDAILAARDRGVEASLRRVLGDGPPGLGRATELLLRGARAGRAAGRPLYAGLSALPLPDGGWGRLWLAANMVREHRGDAHIAAWTAAGLDPVEAGLLTEVYFGMPRTRYHATRGWPMAALHAGLDRLRGRGLLHGDPVEFTEAGAAFREEIELATDRQQAPVLEAIGADVDELDRILESWAGALVAAGDFPGAITQIPEAWGRPPAGH